MTIKGKAFVFSKNIDTDQIYPGRYLELFEPADVAKHAMEGANP
ncbi:MAG: 3-isopropylmalate dehydratase small subunit, partial [Bacillota bacterium]|nr:3-isopropylmalate dehydratase small subunit [Bacillota bacterium]